MRKHGYLVMIREIMVFLVNFVARLTFLLSQTAMHATFTSVAGLTGVIATTALVLMVTSAMEFIRRNYFELFWYTHHLFIVYIICLGIHGLG